MENPWIRNFQQRTAEQALQIPHTWEFLEIPQFWETIRNMYWYCTWWLSFVPEATRINISKPCSCFRIHVSNSTVFQCPAFSRLKQVLSQASSETEAQKVFQGKAALKGASMRSRLLAEPKDILFYAHLGKLKKNNNSVSLQCQSQ